MMIITPVESAFSHCLELNMSGDFTESQHLTDAIVVDNETALNHQAMLKGQDQGDLQCQHSNTCAFHGCGGFGMTLSISSFNVIAATYSYLNSKYSPLHSTALSAEIKPPIMNL
jgi:hypothetical protein